MDKDLLRRIAVDPEVLCGKPMIRGTRISVELVLERLAQGFSFQDIINQYDLDEEDIKAALFYASKTIAGEEVYEAL
ncbi:MAG: DUF433 domain-containing protein [Bacillota bacterium]|nr:DUF433 domain-containing protein [Bacillota bacterium]